MYIHRPDPKLSTAENFLRMLRPNKQYTQLEAQVLDVALMLHMEHGGGNNSTFTTRVVTSAGTDTYSAIAAAMSSLKGPKHGGANIKVMQMMNDIRENVHDWSDRDEVKSYLGKMLDGQVFDKKGLIYGMGHAVYSLSDPRERVFRSYVEHLAEAKGRQKDMNLYNMIEEVAPELIAEKRHIFKGVSPNVDFTVVSYMKCLAFRRNCIHHCLPLQELQDGVHTGWRSWWDATKLFVQHIRVSWKNWNKIITADRIAFYFALC